MSSTASEVRTQSEEDRNVILPVHRVSRDGGDYVVKCPHCEAEMWLKQELGIAVPFEQLA